MENNKKRIITLIAVAVVVVLLIVVIVFATKKNSGSDNSNAGVKYERNDEEATAASIEVKTDSASGYSELIPLTPVQSTTAAPN